MPPVTPFPPTAWFTAHIILPATLPGRADFGRKRLLFSIIFARHAQSISSMMMMPKLPPELRYIAYTSLLPVRRQFRFCQAAAISAWRQSRSLSAFYWKRLRHFCQGFPSFPFTTMYGLIDDRAALPRQMIGAHIGSYFDDDAAFKRDY